MRVFSYFTIPTIVIVLQLTIFANQEVKINFKNLDTENLIKITSKIVQKDILITSKVEGKVQYISNKPINKKNILDILRYDLQSKGFSLLNRDDIFLVVKNENLLKYDKKKIQNIPTVAVLPIKNVDSKFIVQIVKDIITKQQKKDKPYISLDEQNNRVVIYGLKEDINTITKIVQKLDTPQQQVYVEAKIIEISETRTQNIGLEYGLNGFYSSGSSLNTFASSLNSLGSVNPLSLTQLSGYGYSPAILKSSITLGATINLLKENKALEVVSEPSILCINNKESSIYVGETRSVPTGTTVGTTTTTNYEREDIGLRLTIKPRLSSNNKVTLDIKTTIEDIKLAATTSLVPDTNKKEVLTTAIVNNGENVIIGGLIKNKMETSEYKVPFLGDIPLLGTLFKSDYDYEDKINLVIIVTPYIVPKSKDLTYIAQQLSHLRNIENNYTKELEKKLTQNKQNKENKENNQELYDNQVEDILN
jgi:general secretion pathway protein D